MLQDKRFLWGAAGVALLAGGSAIGLNLFFNEAHEARNLDRETFQTAFVALLAIAVAGLLALIWFVSSRQDEVVSAGERVSIYWGYSIGGLVWCMTPWLTSVPDWLVDSLSNPDGDTLFTLSEATGAYMTGGLTLIVMVAIVSTIIRLGWWYSKR